MAKLFLAVDATGATRFVGDVQRGSACGCFCVMCGTPLVAKQGEGRVWHFAHEASNERPECRVGAMNLLRRLAVEEFAAVGVGALPSLSVPHPIAGNPPIECTAHAAGALELAPPGGPHSPAATFPLAEGGVATVYVCIDREAPPSASSPRDAILAVRCPFPPEEVFRTEAETRAFVRRGLRMRWEALPDFSGRVSAAQAEAKALFERTQRERADQAGRRWAQIRRAAPAKPQWEAPPPADLPSRAPAPQTPISAPAWAPGLLAGSSIHYRAMDDGSQWVCFQDAPNRWRLCPVPDLHDGWDESFPPGVAVPEGPRWLRVVDFGRLLMLFNAHAKASAIDSDPAVIEGRFVG